MSPARAPFSAGTFAPLTTMGSAERAVAIGTGAASAGSPPVVSAAVPASNELATTMRSPPRACMPTCFPLVQRRLRHVRPDRRPELLLVGDTQVLGRARHRAQ